MKRRYIKKERLMVIMDIINKLRNFVGESGETVNLYNEEYSAVKQLKIDFDAYLNQDDETSITIENSVKFEELNRKIQYRLPAFSPHEPMFIMKKPS
jgi:hypothetical protein